MKYCSANSDAADLRSAWPLAGTAGALALRNGRWGPVRKWLSLYGCALVLCSTLYFAMAPNGFAGPAPSVLRETPALQSPPQQTNSSTSAFPQLKTPEQTTTEQYTLSHERQAKAVAYSRAGYTLYFISYFLGGLFLFLILRLGWAAKFREISENASDK